MNVMYFESAPKILIFIPDCQTHQQIFSVAKLFNGNAMTVQCYALFMKTIVFSMFVNEPLMPIDLNALPSKNIKIIFLQCSKTKFKNPSNYMLQRTNLSVTQLSTSGSL